MTWIEWIVHYKLSIWGTHLWKPTYKMNWNDTASSASAQDSMRSQEHEAKGPRVSRSNARIKESPTRTTTIESRRIRLSHAITATTSVPDNLYTEYLILLTSKVAYWFLLTFVIYIYILYIYIVMTPPPVAQFQKTLLPCQSRWLWILSWAIYVKKKGG